MPAGDLNALVAAIEPYFRTPLLAKEQGRAALEFVHANFSLEAEARSIRAVYDRLWTEGRQNGAGAQLAASQDPASARQEEIC